MLTRRTGLLKFKTVVPIYPLSLNSSSGLNKALRQPNSVDTSTSGGIEKQFDDIEENAPTFSSFFLKLMTVMESTETKAKMEPTEAPKTPDRPTHSVNPNNTNSSIGSGTSSQGKPEEPVKELANELIGRVLSVMKDDFKVIEWSKSPYKPRLSKQ